MKTACFFSTEGRSQLVRQQYSIQDINILGDLGFEVHVASRFWEIPWGCALYFGWWASGSFLPLLVSKLSGRPLVVVAGGNEALMYRDSVTGEPAGYLSAPLYKKLATRLTLLKATAVIVVSEFMQRGIQELCNRSVTVIHNSINTELFTDTTSPRSFITTAFSMDERVVRLKRADVFFRSIPLVIAKHPDQKFVVIGRSGTATPRIFDLLDKLGIRDRVLFVGSINNTEVAQWMQQSKAYVQISDTETFGVAIGEAMSCKTPVIVSRTGAIPEVVGENGIYVNHNEPESVAAGMLKVLDMTEHERNTLGSKLRDRVVSSFSYVRRKEAIRNVLLAIGVAV